MIIFRVRGSLHSTIAIKQIDVYICVWGACVCVGVHEWVYIYIHTHTHTHLHTERFHYFVTHRLWEKKKKNRKKLLSFTPWRNGYKEVNSEETTSSIKGRWCSCWTVMCAISIIIIDVNWSAVLKCCIESHTWCHSVCTIAHTCTSVLWSKTYMCTITASWGG